MYSLMINSILASPIPSTGKELSENAISGLPRFIIIFVFGLFIFLRFVFSILYFSLPSYMYPTSPSAQLTVTKVPFCKTSVALSHPTTAGIPNSLLTIAAWQVLPPLLVMIALAVFIIGSQSGVVVSATKTSPGLNSSSFLTSSIT